MNTQVGHVIPGADDGAQVMQLTQVRLAQIVSAVSQARTQQIQQIAQQVQSPIMFDVPTFEGNLAASWLAWIQGVVYQAKACGFEIEMTAAEGEELSVGADPFDSCNVDPVRIRNTHVAWMTLTNSCKRIDT